MVYIRSSEDSTRKPHLPLPSAVCYWCGMKGFTHSNRVESVHLGAVVCFGEDYSFRIHCSLDRCEE